MKIAVCVKTVPATDNVTFDPDTGSMVRTQNNLMINPDDTTAIETALYCAGQTQSEVTALSMGPSFYQEGLRYALSMGADKAVLLSSKAFACSDVLATAYTLGSYIKDNDFDLVICGNHSSDGSTGQTPIEMAQLMNIRHIGCVSNILKVTEEYLHIEQQFENSVIQSTISYPCVLVPRKELFTPRIPSVARTIRAKRAQIDILDESMFDIDISKCGLYGSATTVTQLFSPEPQGQAHMINSTLELGRIISKICANIEEKP